MMPWGAFGRVLEVLVVLCGKSGGSHKTGVWTWSSSFQREKPTLNNTTHARHETPPSITIRRNHATRATASIAAATPTNAAAVFPTATAAPPDGVRVPPPVPFLVTLVGGGVGARVGRVGAAEGCRVGDLVVGDGVPGDGSELTHTHSIGSDVSHVAVLAAIQNALVPSAAMVVPV